ncbi:hypothetical protein CSUB01_01654 [Colletotrichum sublineola]|uniref:Uncharacterized protein n=1 Tax=Colletotrichum sublineola TaxID=1173701 RepID=A0A066Y0E3_COLSU|nr:hypothetical protein CSUB01_01654 [Colletotrichum sublineola]
MRRRGSASVPGMPNPVSSSCTLERMIETLPTCFSDPRMIQQCTVVPSEGKPLTETSTALRKRSKKESGPAGQEPAKRKGPTAVGAGGAGGAGGWQSETRTQLSTPFWVKRLSILLVEEQITGLASILLQGSGQTNRQTTKLTG